MKKFCFMLLLTALNFTNVQAQRFTDALDRGLVAVSAGSGNFVSWRRLAEEYYDVTYNVYRDGKKVATEISATHLFDTGGDANSKYTVSPVVRGTEQPQSGEVKRWTNSYLDIKLANVYDRNGDDVTSNYSPNDAEMADLDGDGDLEIIIKRLNTVDAANIYPVSNTTEFVMLDAYDVNWQTGNASLLWRIDCGPNMVSLNSTEINIIAYDWDEDGEAEVVLRGADNMIVYGSNGTTPLYTIGDMNVNTRDELDSHTDAERAWTRTGNEYLLYLRGKNGSLWQKMDYPLTRESADAWGLDSHGQPESYGHRSSKYFFGTPFLDGQKASLFLARGIYGRHKMMALDLNRTAHTWSTRWTWNNNTLGSPWYGQGYHNFVIADVDEDGRDEIVYGSMVIDDTGNGLSTTGFGHGDAQHVSDFDPYRKGLEFFGCNEDEPAMNYRNATTAKIYHRTLDNDDDGRALMDNFSNSYPGSMGRSVSSNMFSSVSDSEISGMEGDNFIAWGDLNFRIYWDGDLCSEILNSPGTAKDAKIDKPGKGRLFTSSGCNMNNDSKNNPCFQGDILGDWREEILLRCGTDVRLYMSTDDTDYDFYTLWHDHQYRQAMVWQMMAYNQPPHLSFFLGEMEGFTVAPPPLTNTGRTIVTSAINAQHNDLHVMAYEAANMTINVSDNAAPYIFTDNAPSHVQGNDDNDNISYTYYTHTLTGSGFSGDMRLVKQGDGILVLPAVNEAYTGPTDVWAGTLQFNGTMEHSKVYMHRLTTLNTTQGTFSAGISMEYGASLNIGGATAGNISSVNISELTLGYGASVVFDVVSASQRDWLEVSDLIIDESKYNDKTWKNYGPEYIKPVFFVNLTSELDEGTYAIGHAGLVKSDTGREITSGETLNITVDCDENIMNPDYLSVYWDGGTLYLKVDKSVMLEAPEITLLRMEQYDNVGNVYPSANAEDYWLPVVGLDVEATTLGTIPTLSGTFTNLNGETTTFGQVSQTVLYEDDYNDGSTTGWSSPSASGFLSNQSEYVCFDVNTNQGGNRNAVLQFPVITVPSTASNYTIEFDAAITPGTDGNYKTQLTVFTVGTVPTNSTYDINNEGYLFSMINQGGSSTVYTINGSSSLTVPSGTWCHYKIEVNLGDTPTASYTITNKSSNSTISTGTRTITDGYTTVTKINFSGGRPQHKFLFDNISVISGASNPTEFKFTEPGTVELTASLSGYRSSTATYEVELPYYRYYYKKYCEINGSNIAALLGSKWNTTATTSRWANWNKANATYGESYQMYFATVSNDGQFWLSPDNEPKVVYMENNGGSNKTAAVVESFGIGRNDTNNGSTFHVVNAGNEKTLIYYDFDESWGNAAKHNTAWVNAGSDGTYTLTCSNNTLAELGVYVPVAIHDELVTTLPDMVADANAVIYRTGLNTTNTWASLVLPFSVTTEDFAATFGTQAVVANLQSSDSHTLYFDTQTAAITANQPVLIKNVSTASPYLFFNLSSYPMENPTQTLDNGLQFIGSYINEPNKPFYLTDYFFTSSTDEDNPEGKISQVATNGMTMNMKGYRAYFKLPGTSAGKTLSVRFDENDANAIVSVIGEQAPVDVYNLAGQMVRRNVRDLRGLPNGLYIIRGRLVTVK